MSTRGQLRRQCVGRAVVHAGMWWVVWNRKSAGRTYNKRQKNVPEVESGRERNECPMQKKSIAVRRRMNRPFSMKPRTKCRAGCASPVVSARAGRGSAQKGGRQGGGVPR